MGMTPQQVLVRLMSLVQTGEITVNPLLSPNSEGINILVGYAVCADPVYTIFTQFPELEHAIRQSIGRVSRQEGGAAIILTPARLSTDGGDLSLLTDEERRCWELREDSIRSIAFQVGCSPSTVRRRLASAREKLLHMRSGA